ncbi:hypothetical protein TH61_10210 [Rufibacter sp. DG15C]|nr:hypothetical protein TH61_10210 [Rufibacter sp. DG15C]
MLVLRAVLSTPVAVNFSFAKQPGSQTRFQSLKTSYLWATLAIYLIAIVVHRLNLSTHDSAYTYFSTR